VKYPILSVEGTQLKDLAGTQHLIVTGIITVEQTDEFLFPELWVSLFPVHF
jgi:hypothetical protein